MKHLNCRDIEPLLPATAAGALDGEDEQTVNDHLAQCPPCLKHLYEFQEAVEQLAYAVPQIAPPTTLRLRVLKAIVAAPQAPQREVLRGPVAGRTGQAAARPGNFLDRLRFLYLRSAPAALAACVVLLLASGVWMGIMAQEMTFMDQEQGQQKQLHDFLELPATQMLTLKPAPTAGTATAQLIMAPGQNQVAIIATHLPQAGQGQGYRLWMLDHGNSAPVHAGWLWPDGQGVVMDVIHTPTDPLQKAGLRITEEPVAGDGSTGTTLLEGWYR